MKKKICIVASKGGHLFQAILLKKTLKNYKKTWVTFRGFDSSHRLKGEKVIYAYYPESRNLLNAVRNFFLALRIINKNKPEILISTGAGIAVPFFIVGKLFRIKLLFIEPYDFVSFPSLTGRILYKISDIFLVQHKRQLKWFPKALYLGSLL